MTDCLSRARSNMQDLVAEYQQYENAGVDEDEVEGEYYEEEGVEGGEVRSCFSRFLPRLSLP